jgi:hypothetical protein
MEFNPALCSIRVPAVNNVNTGGIKAG